MPVPTPREGESEREFVSRCISELHDTDPKREQNQNIAICYSQWREQHKSTPLDEIIQRLENVKDFLVRRFGDLGRELYEHTLHRLGVMDNSGKGLNIAVLKSDVPLPFIKQEGDVTEIGNLILFEHEFGKVDAENHEVSGYANTLICDSVDDLVLPESYKESVQSYHKKVFFMHHADLVSGHIKEDHIDEIGWYVKSSVVDKYWPLVEDGTIKGYSIGGVFTVFPTIINQVKVWRYGVRITDLSHVSRPCNKLCLFDMIKSQSRENPMIGGHSVNVTGGLVMQKAEPSVETTKQEGAAERLGAGGYACKVGDQWKLPIHDEAHVRNAMARYNQAEGCQTPEVKARICAAARHFDVKGAFENGGFCHQGKEEKENIGEKKMSEKKKESEEEDNETEEEEEMHKPTIQEQLTNILEQYREEGQAEVLKALQKKRAEDEKAKEQDRIGELEKKFGTLDARFNEVIGKLDAIGVRITKMEEEPAMKPTAVPKKEPEDISSKIAKIVKDNVEFTKGFEAVEEIVAQARGAKA